ncbi:MAG TPA: hypothetical protein VJL90_07245 [Pseudorhodoplanes sp.]|nr:hypothetical protein [Pseudorhodoplanes sp.]
MGGAILNTLLRQRIAIIFGLFGIAVLSIWARYSVPMLQDLTVVEGRLLSYSIESSDTAHRTRDKTYVLFAITGHSGRFWTEAVSPDNVKSVFTRAGLPLKFHRKANPNAARPLNGDAVKAYGLTVDGVQIKSAQDTLRADNFAFNLIAVLGIISLLVAVYRWRKNARRFGRAL